MDVADKASRCAKEAADGTKEECTEMMPTAIPDPPEIGGVEPMKTDKGNLPRNAGTMARKAKGRESVGKSALIRKEPDPDRPTKEIGNVRTTSKDPEKPKKGLPL